MITQEILRERFDYKDGQLIYKVGCGQRGKIGNAVGWLDDHGYIRTEINKRPHRLHRLIWIYHNEDIPADIEIDHINGVRGDNRIENLRIATRGENNCNVKTRKDNKSGTKGVIFMKDRNQWAAYISKDNKKIHLGCFDIFQDAVNIRKLATEKYHKEFANY